MAFATSAIGAASDSGAEEAACAPAARTDTIGKGSAAARTMAVKLVVLRGLVMLDLHSFEDMFPIPPEPDAWATYRIPADRLSSEGTLSEPRLHRCENLHQARKRARATHFFVVDETGAGRRISAA